MSLFKKDAGTAPPETTDIEAAEPGNVTIEDGMGVIRIPLSEIHALRVALAPCPCKSAKSNSTAAIRQRLSDGLAKLAGQMDRRR